jgi:hypothetical protein
MGRCTALVMYDYLPFCFLSLTNREQCGDTDDIFPSLSYVLFLFHCLVVYYVLLMSPESVDYEPDVGFVLKL